MMNLTISIQVSVDGVMQANGGNNDELDPGFSRGGWSPGRPDPQVAAHIASTWQRADAFLLGRKAYTLFAGYWGAQDDDSNPFSGAMNHRPKYVVSSTLTEPRWKNSKVISGDIAARIRDLKAQPGGELVVVGSGGLARWLLENELVDEINLIVFPVIVGDGVRLFPQHGKDFGLELVDTQAFPTGVLAHIYRPTGRPHYVSEINRQGALSGPSPTPANRRSPGLRARGRVAARPQDLPTLAGLLGWSIR